MLGIVQNGLLLLGLFLLISFLFLKSHPENFPAEDYSIRSKSTSFPHRFHILWLFAYSESNMFRLPAKYVTDKLLMQQKIKYPGSNFEATENQMGSVKSHTHKGKK